MTTALLTDHYELTMVQAAMNAGTDAGAVRPPRPAFFASTSWTEVPVLSFAGLPVDHAVRGQTAFRDQSCSSPGKYGNSSDRYV